MVLGVDRSLHVVADDAGALGLRHHGPRVRVGEQALLVRLVLELLLEPLHAPHLLAQRVDLLAQPLGLGLGFGALGAVGDLKRLQVPIDALFDLLLAPLDLRGGEIAVAAVDRLELATVDGDDRLGEQGQVAAQPDPPVKPSFFRSSSSTKASTARTALSAAM